MEKFDDIFKKLEEISENTDQKTKNFLKNQSKILKKKVMSNAKARIKKKTGKYLKKIKEGKIYKFNEGYSRRVYSSAPHGHLIEEGHRIVKDGQEIGRVKGKWILRDSANEFADEFEKNSEGFLDELFKDF